VFLVYCGLGFVGWGVGVGRRETMRESAGVRFGLMGGGEKVELCLCFCMMCDALALVMFVEGLMVFCCCWMVWLPGNGEKLI